MPGRSSFLRKKSYGGEKVGPRNVGPRVS